MIYMYLSVVSQQIATFANEDDDCLIKVTMILYINIKSKNNDDDNVTMIIMIVRIIATTKL